MAEKVGVFVSHHHSPKEDAFTARLVADLEAAGADVWVDYQGIASGSFVQKINEGLFGRQWLVLVMTSAALGSRWVQDEVNAALHQVNVGRMHAVIPVVMTRCDEAKIPPLWAQLHRYDATRNYESARDGLLSAMGLPRSQARVRLYNRDVDIALLKSVEGLLSLSPREVDDAVVLMLKANGYRNIQWAEKGSLDLHCTTPDGRNAGVLCKVFEPGHLITKANLVMAGAMLAASQDMLKTDSVMVIVMTTSSFTPEALGYAKTNEDRMQLIDGQQLVSMMQRVQPQ